MFTMDNTEGFSQTDLDTLNDAARRILASIAPEDLAANEDEIHKAIADRLNNAWVPGATIEDLVAEAQI